MRTLILIISITIANGSVYSQQSICDSLIMNEDKLWFESSINLYAAMSLVSSQDEDELARAYELLQNTKSTTLSLYNCGVETAENLNTLAYSLYYLNEYASSVQFATLSIDIDENNKTGLFVRSKAKFSLEDYHGTIDDGRKLLKLLNESEDISDMRVITYRNLGYSFMALGQKERDKNLLQIAKAFYNKAIEIEPEFGLNFYFKGIVLALLDEERNACLSLSRAGELGVTESYKLIKDYCN